MGMMLDYIPLAIAQAAAVINHRKSRMTIARYLKCLQESEKIWLEDKGDSPPRFRNAKFGDQDLVHIFRSDLEEPPSLR